jgi:glutathione S-transferase
MSYPEFKAAKATLPTGKLPMLEVTDDNGNIHIVAESDAILRYVAKLAGGGLLYPTDDNPLEALKIDMLVDFIEEAGAGFTMTIIGPKGYFIQGDDGEGWTKQEILQIRQRLMEPGKLNNAYYYLQKLNEKLKENGTGWLVGDHCTIADLKAFMLISWVTMGVLDGVPKTCLDEWPMLKDLLSKIEALPAVVDYRKHHGGGNYGDFDFVPNTN